MTKAELKAKLEANGTLHTKKSTDTLWKEAFNLYNSTNKQKLNINCGGCWTKVKEWLLS